MVLRRVVSTVSPTRKISPPSGNEMAQLPAVLAIENITLGHAKEREQRIGKERMKRTPAAHGKRATVVKNDSGRKYLQGMGFA